MIKFIKVSAKNFLSIGNIPIEITFKDGLNIITGINLDKDSRGNGSGKSAISCDAPYFAMFGKTPRGLNKNDVINKRNKKDAEVTLEFVKDNKTYVITRRIKPSELILSCDGKDITRDSIASTQADINDLLGVSEDIIKNSVIMGINQTVPFMAQGKVEKRKFIEGIFDMTVFSEMLKSARSDYNDTAKQLTSISSEVAEKEKSFGVYKSQFETFEESKLKRIIQIKEKIVELKPNIETLKSQKQDVDELDKKLGNMLKQENDIDTTIDILTQKITENIEPKKHESTKQRYEIQSDINSIKKQIDGAFKDKVCPTCNHEMTDDDLTHVNNHIDKLKNDIIGLQVTLKDNSEYITKVQAVEQQIKDKIREHQSEKQLLSKQQSEIDKLITYNAVIDDKISDIEKQIDSYKETAKEISEETNDLENIIKKTEIDLETGKETIQGHTKTMDILEQVKFIFGENGVKSYIINKMLNIFNSSINKYLDKLNANCVVTFNEFFEDTIINDKKYTCSYQNFSSGERRNIDIAIMFAFMDLQKLQGNFDSNLIVMDEVIDGALDSSGVEYFIDILQNIVLTEKKSIYIVTHRKDVSNFVTGESIEIVKENGISKRKI